MGRPTEPPQWTATQERPSGHAAADKSESEDEEDQEEDAGDDVNREAGIDRLRRLLKSCSTGSDLSEDEAAGRFRRILFEHDPGTLEVVLRTPEPRLEKIIHDLLLEFVAQPIPCVVALPTPATAAGMHRWFEQEGLDAQLHRNVLTVLDAHGRSVCRHAEQGKAIERAGETCSDFSAIDAKSRRCVWRASRSAMAASTSARTPGFRACDTRTMHHSTLSSSGCPARNAS